MRIPKLLCLAPVCAAPLAAVAKPVASVKPPAVKPAATQKKLPSAVSNVGLPGSDIPIRFTLAKPGTVTLVIEDEAGKRVRNLIAAVRLPAGENLLSWDGYDDGEKQEDGSTLRRLVAPGRYRVRGLTSDGLKLIYEFPVNSPGNPPWFTKDRAGAWLADHTSAQSVVMVPASAGGALGEGKDRLIFSAITAEMGHAFMALDLDGKKIVGSNDFGWTGAYAMAIDKGPQALREEGAPWLYAIAPEGKTVRLNAFTRTGGTTNILQHTTKESLTWNGGKTGDSIAMWNGWAVISVPHDNELLLVDARAKKVAGRIPMQNPRGMAFDNKGQLLVATANKVERFTLDTAGAKLSDGAVVVSGLEDAQQITLDGAGNIYVGDWGKQHVVKMFSPDGKLARIFGKPGGPQLGKFDAARMHYPKGLAVDTRGELWVVDADHLPKRISAWAITNGKLTRSLVGGPKYGGGGTLDPEDRTKMYYGIFNGGYSLKLDWKAGTATVDTIYTRPEQWVKGERDKFPGGIPEDAIHIGKHTFLVTNYVGELAGNPAVGAIWRLDEKGIAWPVAVIGGIHLQESTHGSWNPERNPGVEPILKSLAQKTGMSHLLIWSDKNLDGRTQPEEIMTWPADAPYSESIRFNSDMSFTMRGVKLPKPTVLPNGVPVWPADLKQVLVTDKPGVGNAVAAGGDWVIRLWGDDKKHGVFGFRNRQRLWDYPFQPYEQITTDPGMIVHGQRYLGSPFTPREGQAGMMFGINGEKGNIYLMTADGLFIQDIGGDLRVTPPIGTKYPTAKRGMVMENVSFYDEHYGPSLSQTKEGDVILIAGKEFSAIFRVDGLQTIKRQDFATLELDAKRLAGLPPTITRAARKQGRQTLRVALGGTAPKVNGKLNDWPQNVSWATLDARASAAVRIVGDRLYAAWRTGDPNALANTAGDPKLLFKRGGAVDLMIATNPAADPKRRDPVAGDVRLLASMQNGKPTAVLYRAVVPGTTADQAIPFISPVGKVSFDRVDNVSAQVELAQQGGDIELSFPLAALGLANVSGETTLQGDIGILRGTGAITTQRLYWNNLNTAIATDIPSEARLQPGNWGLWKLSSESVNDGSVALRPQNAKLLGESIRLKKTGEGEEAGYSVGFWDNPNASLQWQIEVPKAGKYRVDLTYGSGGVANDFTFTAGEQKLAGKTANTGGWDTWRTVPIGEVMLPAGQSAFSLSPTPSLTGGLMDFKLLRLIPVK